MSVWILLKNKRLTGGSVTIESSTGSFSALVIVIRLLHRNHTIHAEFTVNEINLPLPSMIFSYHLARLSLLIILLSLRLNTYVLVGSLYIFVNFKFKVLNATNTSKYYNYYMHSDINERHRIFGHRNLINSVSFE